MSFKIHGNTKNLAPAQIRALERLYRRSLDPSDLVSLDLAREVYDLARNLGLRVGLLVNREGQVVEVIVGTREILFLPDLGRYRVGKGRLRRLRLIFSDLSKRSDAFIPADIFTDLEKLRLDVVCAVKQVNNECQLAYAYNLPSDEENKIGVHVELVKNLANYNFDFSEFINDLEEQFSSKQSQVHQAEGALLVGVYNLPRRLAEASLNELGELARTAGVPVLGTYIQRKHPDPRTLVGKGKLNELVLEALRLGAELIIFDTELKPSQWRSVTNATELKVLDRSMLILDIFAQRARSSAGRLQVELAQLKYNLPRLVEMDAGLSRLTGGIGGRGPGETKLEIGRRRIRERIVRLEKMITRLGSQRGLRRQRRQRKGIKLAALLGYTNAGKSTLFNRLTNSSVLAENRLFATLDPTQGKIVVPVAKQFNSTGFQELVLADTVGFIRDLPQELVNAFRATLEELNEADLLIHVMDASAIDLSDKYNAVMETLKNLDLLEIPIVHVLNKVDLIDPATCQALAREYSALPLSAETAYGFDSLKIILGEQLLRLDQDIRIVASHNNSSSS